MNKPTKDAIPAGSVPPEDLNTGQGNTGEGAGEGGKTPDQKAKGQEGAAGKFEGKAPEEIMGAYKELEKKLGAQGNELGLLRQQNQQLLELLAQQKQGGAEGGGQQGSQEATPPLEERLSEIARKVEDGEMDMAEAMAEQAKLIREATLTEAAQIIEQREAERKAEEAIAEFQRQNPDFLELKQSGVLEEIKQQSPIEHDDFSAYWHYKALQAQKLAEEAAKEGFKEGIDQKAKVVEGMKPAGTVLKGPGTEMKNPPPNRKYTDEERRQAMLETLKNIRNQAT